jgi:acyl transferase domain-containing protein
MGELEAWLGRRLDPTLLYEYPTIDALARHLAPGAPAERPKTPGPCRHDDSRAESVAIVGMACRFPGALGIEAFWRLLRDGVDAITEVPAERRELAGPTNWATRWGGFLTEVDLFDPLFFGINHREAASIDPQQRLLLETAWEALEDAGQTRERLTGSRTSVFVGISTNDYSRLQTADSGSVDTYSATGNALSIAANRLSYTFDLRGPSLAVDTACSSSLVAVHLACRSLASGECNLALAAGVNLILSPECSRGPVP